MIAADAYEYIYILIVFILTITEGYKYYAYNSYRIFSHKQQDIKISLYFALFMIIFIGFRPISPVFCDMVGYASAMESHIFEEEEISWDRNFLFVSLMSFLSSNNAAPRIPIITLAFINIATTFLAARKMFPKDTLIALLVIFGTFSIFARLTNGLKAGCAMGLFLCAIAYLDNIKTSLFFMFLSIGFHHSMQMPIAAYILCFIYKKQKFYFLIWLFCLICAILHIEYFQNLFGNMTDESGASYLLTSMEESNFGGRTGFRFDFVLFSSFPVIIGYYCLFKRKLKSKKYSFILNIYLLTNGIWMLCMYAPYTNRIAELSWGIYPIALIYPFLKEKLAVGQYQTFQTIIYINVAFSFFMTFIYYLILYTDR